MDLCIISDTHGQHENLRIDPYADILIHAGDYSSRGNKREVEDFLKWFTSRGNKFKILISGNHDIQADPRLQLEVEGQLWWRDMLKRYMQHDCIYLEDSGCEINGLQFFGSPWTPWFHGERWAFNLHRGEEITAAWKLIPDKVDVLITHGPPQGILDDVKNPYTGVESRNVGCKDLREAVQRIKPQIHCFGHLHFEGCREYYNGVTRFVNAAVLDEEYQMRKTDPIIITDLTYRGGVSNNLRQGFKYL